MVTYSEGKLPVQGWKVTKISDCGKFINGTGFPIIYQGEKNGDYPFYKVADLSNYGNNNYMFKANNYISKEVASVLPCKVIPPKAVVFAKIGAAIFLERKRLTTCDCCIDNNMMAFIPNEDLSSEYIWRVMQSMKFGDLVQITALPSLSGKVLGSEEVFIPESFDEQKVIAETLLAFDSHIDDLAELIEKKKAIRDGALEDLMSGRTRLDGFEGTWLTYPFRQYFSFLPSNTYSRVQLSNSGEIGDIHYGDVLIHFGDILTDKDSIPRLKDSLAVKENTYLKENDVIIADTAEDETVGKAVQVGAVSIPLVAGLHTVACRPTYKTEPGFLGYYMNSAMFHDQLYPYITGIKVSSVSKTSFKETQLRIPSDIEEQKAIVSVLTSMDEEIESLKAERDKMIQIREGAMDDLLTGRVRLSL